MVKRFLKIAGEAASKAKSVLFVDPKSLYNQERHLVSEPFFFEGTNGKGVLLVHGWTCTPYELRRLGRYLNENGYTVSGILLTGHGSAPEDIENVAWQTWVEDIQKGYDELKKTCDKVFVAGTSIGAALTIMLGKENPNISGMVLMATPYRVKHEPLLRFLAKLFLKLGIKYRRKFYPPTFGLSSMVTRMISYQIYPIKSALETFALSREVRKNLEKITQPCLLMQSTHDHIVTSDSMEKLYNKINSSVKKKLYIQKAYHTFISDIKNEHVFLDIREFLDVN